MQEHEAEVLVNHFWIYQNIKCFGRSGAFLQKVGSFLGSGCKTDLNVVVVAVVGVGVSVGVGVGVYRK